MSPHIVAAIVVSCAAFGIAVAALSLALIAVT